MLDTQHKQILLKLAAASVKYGLTESSPLPINLDEFDSQLTEQGACFVTLTKNNQLRGCIGTLVASRPLVQDLVENAYAAAFRDPRFPALASDEYKQLHYHISVLNPPTDMQFTSEQELLAQLRPGVDGLIIEDVGRRATFLPSVWESLPSPDAFLRHLKLKAGLSENHWSDSFRAQRYTVDDFADQVTKSHS